MPGDDPDHAYPTSADALFCGVELTSLKSIHRLCDGKRTLFLVDREGKLADIIDVERWASAIPGAGNWNTEVPAPRVYTAHARATRASGHVCLVLSPNQEIKLFAGGLRGLRLRPRSLANPRPRGQVRRLGSRQPPTPSSPGCSSRPHLDLAESRQGGLFVVVADPQDAAVGS